MTNTIDYNEIKEEIVMFLRNQDIFTTAQRNVTTVTGTGTLSSSTLITIASSQVKNIRSLTVGGSSKYFGTDYSVNLDASGSCVITLATTATASYSVVYDYGSDKIFTDFPRPDLSISSFPRIAVDMIGDDTEDIGLGATNKMTTLSFSIYAYDTSSKNIDALHKAIRLAFMSNQKNFYNLRYVTRVRTGPLTVWQTYGNNKVMLKATDYLSKYNIETV